MNELSIGCHFIKTEGNQEKLLDNQWNKVFPITHLIMKKALIAELLELVGHDHQDSTSPAAV